MTDAEILALPSTKAMLLSWWDEKGDFSPGVSSSVLADFMEDHGWTYAPTLQWLRGTTPCIGEWFVGRIHDTAGIHCLSTGTTADPRFRRLLRETAQSVAEQARERPHGERSVLAPAPVWWKVSRSGEVRDTAQPMWAAAHDGRTGMPKRYYGFGLYTCDSLRPGRMVVLYGGYSREYRVA